MFPKKNKKSEKDSEERVEKKEEVINDKSEKEKNPKAKEEEYLEGWKRCQADFENYRKNQDERLRELGVVIREDMALQIFPVLDNFQMSLDHVPEDQAKSSWVQGILHIQRQLETILKENGIEEIEAKVGDEFNPEIHEAIENHQKEEKKEQHKIKKIISKGYKIGEKIIRAVKVIVN